MSKGKINLQANDGAVIGLVVPDGLTSGERQVALGANLSGITAYHLLQGNLSVDNTVLTNGFGTKLFTRISAGNLVVDTGIDMNTQWGSTSDERFGGLVWVKDRVSAGSGHVLQDTIRGAGYYLQTNNTIANTYQANTLVSFNNNGFTYGDNLVLNAGQVGWNFQTTHRVTGTTNHGKAYTCHYNPFTGFTMVKYEGSGIAGHEIPHHLGRKLGFYTCKQLDGTYNWVSQYRDGYCLYLNATMAETVSSTVPVFNETNMSNGTTLETNGNNLTYIMYGWANSYFDESNKLIGNYEIGVYQGTGAVGNKVKTRGKPAWVMIKRLDAAGNWHIHDNQRLNGTSMKRLAANITQVEQTNDTTYSIITASDGFIINTTWEEWNISGGQYIALVAYDTNSNGGGSYYPLASDTANVQINNALIPLAQGIDSNGAKNTMLSKNETITGLTYTQGKNYVYCDKNGAYGVSRFAPQYNSYNGFGDYFDVSTNKWFTLSAIIRDNFLADSSSSWLSRTNATINCANGTLTLRNTSAGDASTAIPLSVSIGQKYRIYLKSSGNIATYGILIQDGGTNISTYTVRDYSSYPTVVNTSNTPYIDFTASYSGIAYLYLWLGSSPAIGAYMGIHSLSIIKINSDGTPSSSIMAEITEGRNYMNHIVHADNDGGVLYVEELPKIEYKDIVKANEFRGKNACTAWVNFDGATTPPTIRDSYNVSAVIRIGTGTYRIYFKTSMISKTYSISGTGQTNTFVCINSMSLDYVDITIRYPEGAQYYNSDGISVQIFGGN